MRLPFIVESPKVSLGAIEQKLLDGGESDHPRRSKKGFQESSMAAAGKGPAKIAYVFVESDQSRK